MTPNEDQRRIAILAYIAQHIESEGYAPTYRQIGTAIGYSANSTHAVSGHLDKLEAQGLVARRFGSPRSIRLVKGDEK